MAEKDKLAELQDFLKYDVEVSSLDGHVIDVAMDVITKLIEKIKELEKNVKRKEQAFLDAVEEMGKYAKTLEFYANKNNYLHEKSKLKVSSYSEIMKDCGLNARQTLESESND